MRFAQVTQIRISEGNVRNISVAGQTIWEPLRPDGLPAGYTECEYVQLDGGQYVDTGVICDQDSKIELTFTREDSGARYLFGVASSDNKASFTGYQSGTASGSWRFGGAYGRPPAAVNVKHTFTMDKTGIVMDGTKYSYTGTVGTFTTPYTLVIGACHNADGSIGTTRHIGKFYGFKLWDGDTLVRDYTPVKNPSGVYGFWDRVNRTFIGSGNELFTGG